MQKVVIIGGGIGGSAILKLLVESGWFHVEGVADIQADAPALKEAEKFSIATGADFRELPKMVDIVFNVTGDDELTQRLRRYYPPRTVIIPGSVANIFVRLMDEKEHYINRLSNESHKGAIIFNSIDEGMVGIDLDNHIHFINRSAARMLSVKQDEAIGRHIHELISMSELPRVIETGRTELNRELELKDGSKIVTSRFPMIDENGELIGAFAVFKDITEVVSLAEEITDLKEIQTMLQAIIQSSDDAISVVDEKGNGLLVNPAYTRITGLETEQVIGRPASADISEGESMHFKALQTRKPVRGVNLKVGPSKREVIVNVAPIIVDNQLKGSVGVIHDTTEIRSLMKELDRARSIIRTLESKYTFDDIIGLSSEMQLSLQQAKLAAQTLVTVLLRGESGTGKELFAHAIHSASERQFNKFVRVNCAAVSSEQLDAELFGYEEGATLKSRTGAKRGLLEEANNGSIFLDEIGELSPQIQSKLLRVLQEHETMRIGGTKPIPVNVRVIASTNANMEKALLDGTFREDLYYRLNRMPILIPPLRNRKQDIPRIVDRLLMKLNQEYGRNVDSVSEKALQFLKMYDWPGNVRELENILSRSMIFMQMNDKTMTEEHIPLDMLKAKEAKNEVVIPASAPLQEQLETVERGILHRALEEAKGNKSKTAKQLQISLRTLYYKLEKFGLL
ncbi:sigma-54-dependent Fis family transcriptional regulator [Planococcus sp. CP5-4]|uniref:sigma-54 interaction domain-containing protein n=1 Tax=unclassified Planococcus (in: firmicutes) TaxID=2662419 RepID=UPI001C212E31|nr:MULTISPECIES: sigma-54-dependent Fis family transcriptional regulator [unclassified Planococcus (in: firmicutes)]MBU9672744.1 sigma-54-dependent Fis family transcriptional regulator [Planococcus sp. CP5-4_YE]MBV0908517.1 sigma-54-dependent Fis family transcriptional regulator [Planococcus sp. CP5-4_UN]MBW6063285.1 sigma-54-dependent Fis family transcriptional regulator [Planococcus sp. CP5-4]